MQCLESACQKGKIERASSFVTSKSFTSFFFVNELTNWSLYAGGWFLSKRRRSSYWIEQSRAFPVWIRVIDLPSHLQQEKMYKTISILSERGQHRRAENRSLYPFMSNQLRYFLFIQALAMILFGSYTHNVLKKSVKNKGRKWEYLGVFSAVGDNSPLSMKLLWLERGPVSHWRLGTSRVNVVSTDLLRKKKTGGCESSLKQKQTINAPLSKKKEPWWCDYSWVCIVNPPVGSGVCFSFRDVARGDVASSWFPGAMWLLKRDSGCGGGGGGEVGFLSMSD